MADKDLRKLNREELLEMLIAQIDETERLQARLADAERQLEERRILIANAGSIAQASLQLNGVFEAAQAAAEEYLANVRLCHEQQDEIVRQAEEQAQEHTRRMLAEARHRCRQMEQETQRRCDAMLRKARRSVARDPDAKPFRLDEYLW